MASRGERNATGSPSISSWPRSGAMTPAKILPSVDFPAPFSPTSAWIDPCSMVRLIPSRARTPPKDLPMSTSSTCGPRTCWGTSARPLGGELGHVGLGHDAVVWQLGHRVDAAAVLTGAQGLDQRLHRQAPLAGRRLGHVAVPRAGGDAREGGGARAVTDQDHLAGQVLGRHGLDAALDALVGPDDQVQAGVGGQHVLYRGEPFGGAEEALALRDDLHARSGRDRLV